LVGFNFLARYVAFNEYQILDQDSGIFKVLSYNVQNLSNNNILLNSESVKSDIFNYIRDMGSDIVCLQEFMATGRDPYALFDSLSHHANLPYYIFTTYKPHGTKNVDALIIFSRFPIVRNVEIKKDQDHHFAMYADILKDGDTIRVFNIHLESFRFGKDDYEFLTEVDLDKTNQDFRKDSKRVLQKLRLAFEKRSEQVNIINGHIAASPYPVLLCGDFNDTPVSYTYNQITGNLNDAFKKSGKGIGNTYIGRLPSFRIDYILYSDELTSFNYQTSRVRFSDHYPIFCHFSLGD